jgi:hypothetical protein
MMKFFIRAVVTGFALTLGAALYKKLARKLGIEEPSDAQNPLAADGATDPGLHPHRQN